MKMCRGNEPTPSREMLRAFAMGELHGDGAAEMAAHVEHCADCGRLVRALVVLERCDRVLNIGSGAEAVLPVERAEAAAGLAKVAAAWQRAQSGMLELRERLVISLRERHERLVRWADDVALITRTPDLQLLSGGESTEIVKEVPIFPGEGTLACSLRIFRDTHGVTRMGVSFGGRVGGDYGVLRAVLSCGDWLKESKPVADVSDVAFDTQLSPGDYVVQLRNEDREHSIRITVD